MGTALVPAPDNTGDRAVLASLYNRRGGGSRSGKTNWLSGRPAGRGDQRGQYAW